MALSAIQSSDLSQYLSTVKSSSAASGEDASRVELRRSSYTTQISGYGQIRAAFDRLHSGASDLSGAAAFGAYAAASSNPSVVAAKLDNDDVRGAFKVEVSQLASAQSVTSLSQTSPNTLIGSGASTSLSIQFGETSGEGGNKKFTPDEDRAAEKITINTRNNTLNGIADTINTADVGVSAAVTFNGNSYQLELSAKETGAENSFSIAISGDKVLQSYLEYSPESSAQGLTSTVAAQDAKLTVNGVATSASSNSVTTALPGVTFELRATGSAEVSVSENPQNAVAQKVGNFLSAFNELKAQLDKPSASDVSIPPVVRNLKARVDDALEDANRAAGAFGGLAGIGIQADANGNLQLDTTKFQAALGANREGVARIFTDDGKGFADLFAAVAHDLSRVAGREVSRLSEVASKAEASQLGPASGITLQASGVDGQYSGLSGLVQSVDKTDQTLNGLLLQNEAAQSSQSSQLNRLNSLANLATP